ncbi:unnamed protein product [Calypogeia fissa]
MSKLQEGDLTGTLNDLTSPLGMFSEGTDLRSYAYLCWKERGRVNFLLGNFEEAQKDCQMVSKLHPQLCRDPADLKGKPLGEELVTYMHSLDVIQGEKLDVELVTNILSILKPWTYSKVTTSWPTNEVMKMVRQTANSRALAVWYIWGVIQDPSSGDQFFYLQERGILKQFGGDLHGALEDLTTALKDEPEDYDCLKHRAYVKYLLQDEHGARLDAQQCLAMGREQPGDTYLGETPIRFLEFDL